MGERLSVGAESADERRLGAVDVISLDVFAVSVMLVEPKTVLVDVSLAALKRLLAVGIGFAKLNIPWLVEVVAFVPNPPLGVEVDVPKPEKPVALREGPISGDVAAGPNKEPAVVEDEGCTAAAEMPVAVVLGIWVFEGEGFVPNSPPVVEDNDSAVANE